jgi:hypothetical protein
MGELMVDLYNSKGTTRFVVVLVLNEDETLTSRSEASKMYGGGAYVLAGGSLQADGYY